MFPIIPLIVSAIGALAGAAGKGRAEGRAAEQQAGLQQDTAEANRQRAMQDAALQAILADLAQRRFTGDEYQRSVRNAVGGGLIAGMEDPTFTPPPGVQMGTVTGGIKPSAIRNAPMIGNEMQRQAILDLMNPLQPGGIQSGVPGASRNAVPRQFTRVPGAGQTFIPTPASAMPSQRSLPSIPLLNLPPLAQTPQAGGLDKFLALFAPAMSGVGFGLDLYNKSRKPTATPGATFPSSFGGVNFG